MAQTGQEIERKLVTVRWRLLRTLTRAISVA